MQRVLTVAELKKMRVGSQLLIGHKIERSSVITIRKAWDGQSIIFQVEDMPKQKWVESHHIDSYEGFFVGTPPECELSERRPVSSEIRQDRWDWSW